MSRWTGIMTEYLVRDNGAGDGWMIELNGQHLLEMV